MGTTAGENLINPSFKSWSLAVLQLQCWIKWSPEAPLSLASHDLGRLFRGTGSCGLKNQQPKEKSALPMTISEQGGLTWEPAGKGTSTRWDKNRGGCRNSKRMSRDLRNSNKVFVEMKSGNIILSKQEDNWVCSESWLCLFRIKLYWHLSRQD